MKISIVIPTRDRGAYLSYCVRTALACEDRDLEVVVSNNNSQDNTREVLAAFNDPRLEAVHTESDLSMRQNFEFALTHATGDYIIFIGDDDGVLPNGLASLRYLLETHHPDAVTWRHITYLWPHLNSEPRDGLLKFRCRDFFGPAYALNIPAVLDDLCKAKRTNYRDGLNIYHGCISRRVIDQVKQQTTGDYFQGQCPDINTAFANLTAARSAYWLRNPVTLAGAGERSTGSTMKKTAAKVTADQHNMVNSFVELAKRDDVPPEASCQIRSLLAHTYANLDRVVRTHTDSGLSIDHDAWRRAVCHELRTTPDEYRPWPLIQLLFQQIDPRYRPEDHPEPAMPIRPASAADATTPTEHTPQKKRKASRVTAAHLRNIASVVAWLQHVTGSPYRPGTNVPVALCKQSLRAINMQARIRSANRRKPDNL